MAARTLTIVFTDIKGFTARTSKSSRAEMVKILERHEEMLRPIVDRHGGTVVKTIGDAFLLTFESPTNAVLCGIRMQARLRDYNREAVEEERIEIRVAINTGEVETIGSDVFGETVNVASRIEGITEPGEVYFTEGTYLAMNKSEVPTSHVGEFRLKGIPEAVKVLRVVQDENLDLFRKVLESQEAYDQVPPGAHVPEGAYSKSLLYSHEQERSLRRGLDPIIAGVTTVALLVVVGLAFMGFKGMQYRSERGKAARLVEAGQVTEALDILSALRAQKPTDPKLREILDGAVDADIATLLASKQYDEAMSRVEDYKGRYPHLQSLGEVSRRVKLARAEYNFEHMNPREARDLMHQLTLDYPQDQEIKFRYGIRCATTPYVMDLRTAMDVFAELGTADESYIKKPEVIESALEYLSRHALTNQHEGEQARAIFTRDKMYPEIRSKLPELLSLPGYRHATSRRNARLLLQHHSALSEDAEMQFHLAEFLDATNSNTGGPWYQAADYFEKYVATGLPEAMKAAVPEKIPEAPVLKYHNEQAARAAVIIGAHFAEPLKDFLLERLSDKEETGYRSHAYEIAKAQSWLSEELEASYHMANLSDYSPYYAPPRLEASLVFFATPGAKERASDVLGLIEAIEKGSRERVGTLTKEGKREKLPEFKQLNQKAKRALANLRS